MINYLIVLPKTIKEKLGGKKIKVSFFKRINLKETKKIAQETKALKQCNKMMRTSLYKIN